MAYEPGKRKWGQAIIIVLVLWAVSFAVANLLKDDLRGDNILVIPIQGIITSAGLETFTMKGTTSVDILERLEDAKTDNNVKAVILEINSGGGMIVASKEIAEGVKKLSKVKPVIALIREIGASGAYWIASASDVIVADDLSLTGSIGVIGSYLEFSGLMQEYGIGYESLKAGEYKDLGTPFRPLEEKERELLQDMIDKIHDYFIKGVAENRGLEEDKVKELATGYVYLGYEAKELGLVDELGNIDTAFEIAKEKAGIEDAELVRLEDTISFMEAISRFSGKSFYSMGRGIGAELFSIENKQVSLIV